MKRVPFAAPENGMQVRYYVFPQGTSDAEIEASLATEASRNQITEWARTEPPRLDLIIRDSADAQPGVTVELETSKLLADYYHSVEQLPMERLQFVLVLLGLWWVPSLILYAFGLSAGWIVRGFRDTR